MQIFFVALFEADLADVFGATVVGIVAVRFKLLKLALVDAADVAHHMRKKFALRVLTEQAGVDIDTRKAIAVGGETRDFLVGEAVADRQTFEAFAFLQQLLEASTVAWRDFNHARQPIDQLFHVVDLARRDLQRIGRIIVRQHDAMPVDDDAAVGHDGGN